jgi:biotin-dependent carboxylase-like uncharacterized protein
MSYLGATLQTDCTLQAALAGGTAAATLDGEPVPSYQSFTWRAGQVLTVGGVLTGARTYLAVSGGWQVPLVMESAATYVRAALGGYQGRRLQAGDELSVQPTDAVFSRRLPRAFWPVLKSSLCLRYVPGPQEDHFTPQTVELFRQSRYRIAAASDRMGIRLQGPAVTPERPDIVSDAIALGSIQVPKDGQPIIMGPDHQTTGGYPKIGTVLTCDIDQLSQLRPGDSVSWQPISVEEARQVVLKINTFRQLVNRVILGEATGKEYRVKLAGQQYFSFVVK